MTNDRSLFMSADRKYVVHWVRCFQ